MSSELVKALCRQGMERAAQSTSRILLRSVLAGVYIALAGQFTLTATLGAEKAVGFGLARVVGGLAFSLGLILVVLGQAELFTGCNLTVGAAALSRKISLYRLLRQWFWCYIGNALGALCIVALLIGSGLWRQADGSFMARAVEIAAAKASQAFWPAFFRGIGCNILVCLGVLMAAGARETGGKIAAMVFPVVGFVTMGFEHSVANMFFLPLGLWLNAIAGTAQAGLSIREALLGNLMPVTLGNIAGGTLFVAGTYWRLFGKLVPDASLGGPAMTAREQHGASH